MKNLKTRLRLASLLTLTLLACTAAYGQLTPVGDSYTNTAAATTNYGAKTLLDVESTQTSFIQFNLSSIPAGYTSADITQATLKLYVNAVTTAGSFNVDYVNGAWTESTLEASNAPALGTTIAASVPLTTADKNQFILINVTAAVQAWLSGTPNDGIALVANSPLNASFDSKESTTTSHAAELDIVFAGGGTLTGVTTASGSGLTGGGTSGTLTLSLTNACAANQVLQWSGTAWACANLKGSGTITGVTAGTDLTGGGTSGNVTLNLNTAVTNGLYAQLGAANTFTANQTVNGTLTANSSGFTIVGNTSSTATDAAGVIGEATATTGSTVGVAGGSSSPSGFGVTGGGGAVGVQGSTWLATGYGVEGVNEATSGNLATGVYGQTNSPAGGVAVAGTTYGSYYYFPGGAVGTEGATTSATGYGVLGVNGATTGTTAGVYGQSYSNAGYGVYGVGNTGVYASGNYTGVQGEGIGWGVRGTATGSSNTGASEGADAGVWGDTSQSGYAGVLGTADESFGVYAENNDGSGLYPTMVVANFATQTHNQVFQTSSPNTYSGSRHCTIDTSANLTCTGVVSGVVQADDGRQTAIYAMQSAENWLEDAGSGQLSGGSARIELDPAFAQTVNAGVEYHVFLTPNGDSKGLYVSQKTATSFEVHEQGGGTSSIAFDYRIMAKRKGYENVRLEDLTERLNKIEAGRRKARPSAAPLSGPQSGPKMPTPIAMPVAVQRPASVAPKLLHMPPVRPAVEPVAAQPK